MAKVWFVRDGYDPTTGAPAYDDLPLEQCIERLGLEKKDWLHGLDQTPHFQAPRVAVPEYRHVVCEIDEQEASDEVGGQDFICWRSAQDRLRGGSGQLEWTEKRRSRKCAPGAGMASHNKLTPRLRPSRYKLARPYTGRTNSS